MIVIDGMRMRPNTKKKDGENGREGFKRKR